MSTKKVYSVEPRSEGYAVKANGAKRASILAPTQAKAIAAKKLNPDAKPHIARVENTKAGGPNQYRKG